MLSVLLAVITLASAPTIDALSTPLPSAEVTKGRRHLARMQARERGPYTHVAWFCEDGEVLPPKAYACKDHGGGIQHGVLSPPAQWLADRGVFVGTVLAALVSGDLVEENYYRARALLVERYLERTRQGWVMRRARTLRGVKQIEDEEKATIELLTAVASNRDAWRDHRSLLLRLTRALPPGTRSGTDSIRGMATEIADVDSGFTALRSKIHSMPEYSDAEAVRRYRAPDSALQPKLDELARTLEEHYSPAGRERSFDSLIESLPPGRLRKNLGRYRKAVSGRGRIRALSSAIDAATEASRVGAYTRLRVLASLEELAVADAALLASDTMSREGALQLVRFLVRAAYQLGVLSAAESRDIDRVVSSMESGHASDYVGGAEQLRRALEWGAARYRYDLGLALERYSELVPAATGVVDDFVRSGILVPLSAIVDRLQTDADRFISRSHRIVGLGVNPTVFGQYPGLAVGVLRTALTRAELQRLKPGDIAMVRDIPSDMPPVAGIIRIGAAESLSHVALLALNLGIPYAVVSGLTADRLAELAGKKVLLGVSTENQVVLGPWDAISASERREIVTSQTRPRMAIQLKAVDHSFNEVVGLGDVKLTDSGVRVGPKAAKLAELHRLFPEHVAPAIVLPFGLFYRHVTQTASDGSSPFGELARASRRASRRRGKAADRIMFPALARVRQHILTVPFPEDVREQITSAAGRLLKDSPSGVFVRSDTNVEDLPQFTGAGLGLTVENQIETEAILHAIRRVWASAYSKRAYRWRSRLVSDATKVLPSVILQRSVPSEYSGVLVTDDLHGGRKGALTVSIGEGVGAVVGGTPAETIVVLADGTHTRLQSARAVVYKQLARAPLQGVSLHHGRAPSQILAPGLLAKLVALAERIQRDYKSDSPTPLDIEFGLRNDRLWLFQLRPLSRNDAQGRHPLLKKLDQGVQITEQRIKLSEVLP